MKTTHAAAAQAIRNELKAIKVKATVRSSSFAGGNSVDVSITDCAPEIAAKVRAIVAKYEYGHFDGLTDCYEYSNKNSDLPQVKYAHVNHSMSDAMAQAVWTYCRRHWALADVLPADYKTATNLYLESARCPVYELVSDEFYGKSFASFWTSCEACQAA